MLTRSSGAGYYSTANDLTKLGRSILASTLLPPLQTRQWLRPVTHTARASLSIGRPWEIMRLALPVASGSATTRLADLYTKQGATSQYWTLLALSPDHGVGYAVLVAGPQVAATYAFLQDKLNTILIGAVEQAGREQALAAYGGKYTLHGQLGCGGGAAAGRAGAVCEQDREQRDGCRGTFGSADGGAVRGDARSVVVPDGAGGEGEGGVSCVVRGRGFDGWRDVCGVGVAGCDAVRRAAGGLVCV